MKRNSFLKFEDKISEIETDISEDIENSKSIMHSKEESLPDELPEVSPQPIEDSSWERSGDISYMNYSEHINTESLNGTYAQREFVETRLLELLDIIHDGDIKSFIYEAIIDINMIPETPWHSIISNGSYLAPLVVVGDMYIADSFLRRLVTEPISTQYKNVIYGLLAKINRIRG